tara:strand:- start:590 stop:811 length:222 start_codon:yes stop_codon:yes gene_type:complete
MQNDYLSNKKKYTSDYNNEYEFKTKLISKPKIVDVNVLLNKVKIKEKKLKVENLIVLSIIVLVISTFGIVLIL